MRRAVVTLAIGSRYVDFFEACCRESWSAYCAKHGYDLLVVTEALDQSERARARSPSWQKLLILSQGWSERYDQIIWVDSDILMNVKHAPGICEGLDVTKVGAVEAYSIPTREISRIALDRLYAYWARGSVPFLENRTPEEFYLRRGIAGEGLDEVVQAGVFVASPRYHRALFEYVYGSYEDTHGPEWNYEMPALSYELVKAGLVQWISPGFNFVVWDVISAFYPEFLAEEPKTRGGILHRIGRHGARAQRDQRDAAILKNIFELSFFMHFAGMSHLIPKALAAIK